MADEADVANDRAEIDLQHCIDAARKDVPTGVPGDCEECGEPSKRLVDGACAECRDRIARIKRIRGEH